MRKLRQLTFEDRIYIEVMRWEGALQKDISKALGVHPSTVSRELGRCRLERDGHSCGHYMGHIGERQRRLSDLRRGRKKVIMGDLEHYIRFKLEEGWNPEQISGRLKFEGRGSARPKDKRHGD